ncbi:MAG: DUF1080 domain-containing protein [Gemmatimonadetes bacterium]|nr:DUF1080 domain-containing protein [Gemmatimonadota bacterium]
MRRRPVDRVEAGRCRAALTLAVLLALPLGARAQGATWPQHSRERPLPRVVDPGRGALPVPPPADAIVLFDGHDLAHWVTDSGAPATWHLVPGQAMEVAPGTGEIRSKDTFGDVQLHVEWASPKPARGKDQDRGNSGVFLMGKYEVQVLDSYDNVTYADGQAGAVYGQYPPLVNVSRPPGEWQSYDIVFHRPHFDAAGKVTAPGRFTVFHNGVLVQDDVSLLGPTSHMVREPYTAHADRLPIALQDHGHPVRYRNIWARDLEPKR